MGIRELREKNNMNQVELAKRLGISQSCVSQYEKGGRRPTIKHAKLMAEILGCSFDNIIDSIEYRKDTLKSILNSLNSS